MTPCIAVSNPAPDERIPPWELHHRLSRSLEFAGVSIPDMADTLGVAETTMRNYLSGRTRPRRGALTAWALRTGVPLRWIEYGDEPQMSGGETQMRNGWLTFNLSSQPDDLRIPA